MMFFLKLFGLQLTIALAALGLIITLDCGHGLKADGKTGAILIWGCLLGAGRIARLCSPRQPVLWLGYLVLAVYLTVCSITDCQTCKVYDILQFPAAAAGAVVCILQSSGPGQGMELIAFALLQYLLFGKLYGQGDVMGFQICSLYLTGRGGDLYLLLRHMLLAFAMLGVVQALRHNISKKGI